MGLGEMQLTHVAIAVHDIDEASKRMAGLGMSFATPTELQIPTSYRGTETVAGLKFAYAPGNPIPIELVQPATGDSTIARFLRERGEGVQHFGYSVDNVEAVVGRANAAGVEVDWVISDKHGLAIAFLSGEAMFGVSAELVRRDPPVNVMEWLKR